MLHNLIQRATSNLITQLQANHYWWVLSQKYVNIQYNASYDKEKSVQKDELHSRSIPPCLSLYYDYQNKRPHGNSAAFEQ